MSASFGDSAGLPPEQKAIRDRCVHPTGTFTEFTKDEIEQSIPSRFEQQVLRHPQRLAVVNGDSHLTYRTLNRQANRVAHAVLALRGAGEEPTALLFEPGLSVYPAVLGALKAGKSYVPLDSSLPEPRTSYVLENSQSSLLITSTVNLALAQELARGKCQLLNVDELDSALDTGNPDLPIPPDNQAWIIYTSGSTGQPKGVFHNHRNVLHMMMNYTNHFGICPEDRLTLLPSYSVHGGSYGAFMALLNGASLYLWDIREQGLTGVADWLHENAITVFHSVPTVFRNFVGILVEKREFPQIRLIYVAGEPSYERDLQLYKENFPENCIFVNRFGSTEADAICMYFMDKKTEIQGSNLPTGYPVPGKQVLMLDADGQEVGVDEVGEIAVKSRYLALGYWQRPDLTGAAFAPDPQGGEERIYRTGDLGSISADGCLVNLGRKDFQVKIRGYRIEVAEIEMALLNLGGIEEAAVMAQQGRTGDQRLVGYIVPNRWPAPSTGELRRALSQVLPGYMVPSAFLVLDEFPHAPNGKLDRRALPQLDSSRPGLENPFVGPSTPVEEKLVKIWAEVLGQDQVGVQDHFFDLGGDSLLASLVISRVIRTFQVELPLRSLFESPTVADMAAAIVQNQAQKAEQADIERMLAELEARWAQ